MDRLKRLSLEDRFAIQDLIVSYATFLDLRELDALASLFIDSAVLDLPGAVLSGSGQIKAYFQAESAQSSLKDRLHHADSVWICTRDWDCTARSHYFETGLSSTMSEPALLTSGVFEDLIVHCNDGWKFSRRKFAALSPATLLRAS